MAYTPANLQIFTAAFAGALAGMGISDRVPTDTDGTHYAVLAATAGAYAQAVDVAWNATGRKATQLDLEGCQSLSEEAWILRAPQGAIQNGTFLLPDTYLSIAQVVVAMMTAGEAYFTTQSIVPPAIPLTPVDLSIFVVTRYGAKGDGVTDDTNAINAAIAEANVKGGIVYFPTGQYVITKELTVLGYSVRMMGVNYSGIDETEASVILFKGPNTQTLSIISPGYWNDQNVSTFNSIEYLTVINKVDTSALYKTAGVFDQSKFYNLAFGAIEARGATNFDIRFCKLLNFPIEIVLDGAETVNIERIFTGSDGTGYPAADYALHSIGTWIVDGAFRGRGWTVPQSTNNIAIRDSVLGGAFGIFDQGGVSHEFDSINYEGGINCIKIAGAENVTIRQILCEGYTGAPISMVSPFNVTIEDCFLGTTGTNPAIEVIASCYGLFLNNNILYGHPYAVTGAVAIANCTAMQNLVANVATGALLFDGIGIGSNLSINKDTGVGLSINTLQTPAAIMDTIIRDSSKPIIRTRDGAYPRYLVNSPSQYRGEEKLSHNSNYTGLEGGLLTINDWVATSPGGANVTLAAFKVPNNCLITIEFRVNQWAGFDPRDYGYWRRYQAVCQELGGGVALQLIGAIADEFAPVNPAGLTAPILVLDGAGNVGVQVYSDATRYTWAQVSVVAQINQR